MNAAFKLLTLYVGGATTPPPTIAFVDSSVEVSDAEAIGFDVSAAENLLTTGDALVFSITAGNDAGKFVIDADTGLIELAEELNWWNLTTMHGTDQYALTVQVENAGGTDSAMLTVTVTNPYEQGILFGKLNETAGTDMLDYSTVNPGAGTRDGVYSGVALDQIANPGGITAPLGDGINDFVNLYSAALNSAFNGQLFTVSLWVKVFDAAFWSDTTSKYMLRIGADLGNRVQILKRTDANTLQVNYNAGGKVETITHTFSDTGWFHVIVTVDKAAAAGSGELKAFVNAIQIGATVTALGTYAGVLASTQCALFAIDTTGALPAKVYESYLRIFPAALPAAHIAKLAQEFAA